MAVSAPGSVRSLSAPRAIAPAATADGRRLPVRVDVGSAADVRAGIDAGADGIGLLAVVAARAGTARLPTLEQTLDKHRQVLLDVAGNLGAGAVCTVAALDLDDVGTTHHSGGDVGGVALQLRHVEALAAQLDTIVTVLGEDFSLRIALPVVESAEEVACVRLLVPPHVALGAILQNVAGLASADSIARECDFVYLRTRDVARVVSGSTRFLAADLPQVLRTVASVAAGCWDAGIPIVVSDDPRPGVEMTPLLIGVGVSELSAPIGSVVAVCESVRSTSVESASLLASELMLSETGNSDPPVGVLVPPPPCRRGKRE